MRIEELHLKNFRCFRELDIQFPKSNLAVFIGLNGAGKSAILDAISLLLTQWGDDGLRSEQPESDLYSDRDINIGAEEFINEIKFKVQGQFFEWKHSSKKSTSAQVIPINNYSSFPKVEKRVIVQYTAIREKRYYNDKIFHALRKISDGFSGFKEWFVKEEAKENRLQREKRDFNITNSKLDVVREAIERFCEYISSLPVSRLRVKDTENDDVDLLMTWNNIDISLSQLSDGQRNMLLLVSDIAFSLIDKTVSNANISVLERESIVLIDEIELHLHPQWQREVLPALQKTFPNIQFIVTTHSPQVLSNLKKEEVFILKDNKISEFKPYVEGRDSNSILSEIFGVSERPKIFQDKLNEFYEAIDNQKLEEAKKSLKNLEEYWGTSDTEILKADLHLSFAEE